MVSHPSPRADVISGQPFPRTLRSAIRPRCGGTRRTSGSSFRAGRPPAVISKAKWNNGQAYYLCRYLAKYALANRVSHPKHVYLREADVLGQVHDWLAELFAPDSVDATVNQTAELAAQLEDPATQVRAEAAPARIADYGAQISRPCLPGRPAMVGSGNVLCWLPVRRGVAPLAGGCL